MQKFLSNTHPGKIENKPFIEEAQEDDDSEDFGSDSSPTSGDYVVVSSHNEKDREARNQRWKEIEPKMTLRECLTHYCDYAIVGSSAWLLLSRKFGYDCSIERSATIRNGEPVIVIYPKDGGLEGGSEIDTKEDIDFSIVCIPRSFRFNYQRSEVRLRNLS